MNKVKWSPKDRKPRVKVGQLVKNGNQYQYGWYDYEGSRTRLFKVTEVINKTEESAVVTKTIGRLTNKRCFGNVHIRAKEIVDKYGNVVPEKKQRMVTLHKWTVISPKSLKIKAGKYQEISQINKDLAEQILFIIQGA